MLFLDFFSKKVHSFQKMSEKMKQENNQIARFVTEPYKYGFETNIDSEVAPKGLSEEVIRYISAQKHEPEWLLNFRLKAYRHWLTLSEPH